MGSFAMNAIVLCLLVALALFLLVSTSFGYAKLRKAQFAEEHRIGVGRFVAVSTLLVVGFGMQTTFFFMTQLVIAPQWFLCLLRVLSDVLIGGSLLYYIFMAARSVYLARTSSSNSARSDEMAEELLPRDSDSKTVPLMYANV